MDDITVIFENEKKKCNNKSMKINKAVQTEHVNNRKKFNKEINNRKEHPTFLKNAKHFWWQWSENTSLHGVRYLCERRRSVIEKLWWVIIFGIALSFCTFWIVRTYNRWITTPIIVNFAEIPTSVWEIPFPAVTVCPAAKLKRELEENYNSDYDPFDHQDMTEEESATVNAVNLLCPNVLLTVVRQDFSNNTLVDSMIQESPKSSNTFDNCKWNKEKYYCNDLFAPVLTEAGICYTFNTLDPKDIYTHGHLYHYDKNKRPNTNWNLESGYSKGIGNDSFPKRARSADGGLQMDLQENGYYCDAIIGGYKISLHRPDETPRTNRQYFKIGINEEVVVTVTPNMMSTSDDVKDFPSEKRKCYFSDERKLQFYKNYTQHNCEMECLANYTLKWFGCVEYYMPRNESTKICGAISSYYRRNQRQGEIEDCNCLQECTSLSYLAETSQVAFRTSKYSDLNSIVKIFFKESQFIPIRRSVLYSLEDFLANCGGVLGLFIGFSLLSLAEIIYFLTFRVFCNIRRFGKHFWSGSPELVNEDKNDIKLS